MKNFLKSNTFLLILSIVISVVIWVYVAYVERPIHEVWIEDVPVKAINVSQNFEDGSISIIGENSGLLSGQITTDIKIKGKRSTIASINKNNVTCYVDMINIDKAGDYTRNSYVETAGQKNIEIVRMNPSKFKFKVENINQRDIDIELKQMGEIPQGYTLEELVNKNKSVKITGPESAIDKIKTARITLDLSSLDVNSTEKRIKIEFLDSRLEPVDSSEFGKSVEYAKVSYKLYTVKEVSVVLMPRYKDGVKENAAGNKVNLSVDEEQNLTSDGGLKLKVKLKGTNTALEKYLESDTVIYTEEINVRNVYSDTVFKEIEASELADDITFVTVPKVDIKATVIKD